MEFYKKMVAWYKQQPLFAEVCEWIGIILIVFVIRTIGFGLYQVPTGSMETTMLCGERFFADKFTPLFTPYKHGDVITFDEPTYKYSDNVLVNWWQRYVWGPSNWTKRVIGVPGDHIEGRIEDGKPVVYRNGQKLEEPYLNKYPLIAVFNKSQNQVLFKSYDSQYSYDTQPFYRMTEADVLNAKVYLAMRGFSDRNMLIPHSPTGGFRDVAREGMPVGSADIFDVHLGPDEYWAMGDNRQNSTDSRFWGPLKKNLMHGKVKMCLYSIDITDSWGTFEWLHIFPFDIILHPIDFWQWVRWSRCLKFIHQ